ncbi:polysaccharide export protein [Qipengyuania sp. GH38]|uniref:polysaccharide biosynthesis/export family protein n=1 Tax=Qipengyuania intermedia TaxID=2867244 RepID=UPI001C869570|nr:polysaccharide biosynthesis/export family protein [Qipengyuania intermedia]MBX7514694.1 polysaccharide export protein [Qipengyuania intermedia]
MLAASLAAAACQTPLDPVVPEGQAGYDAVVIDPQTALPQRYTLAPGDVLSVAVFGEADLSVERIAVDNAGVVTLPLIGDVRAVGRSASELGAAIEAAYATNYLRDPRVSVAVLEARDRTIAVEGEVEQPGVFSYAEGQTLLSALALARSPTDTAKLDEVMIFRTVGGERTAGRFDLRAIRGGRMPDVALVPGDVVVVGYSSVRGAWQDVLRAVPVFGIFRPIG